MTAAYLVIETVLKGEGHVAVHVASSFRNVGYGHFGTHVGTSSVNQKEAMVGVSDISKGLVQLEIQVLSGRR
jgi:hypothetical protein